MMRLSCMKLLRMVEIMIASNLRSVMNDKELRRFGLGPAEV